MKKSTFNRFLAFKLPIAKIAGVKLYSYNESTCQTLVKYGWLNQNPFKSMFWAVQGMAAELSTGTLCISRIMAMDEKVSMLVVGMEARFVKKAVGKIIFTCDMGNEVAAILQEAKASREPRVLKMKSTGRDEAGDKVAEFIFTWSFKVK